MAELAARVDINIPCHRPGIPGAVCGFQKVSKTISAWTPSEYEKAVQSCLEIVEKVCPAVAVIDPILRVGLDACRTAKFPIVVLWPVPLKDVVLLNQPKAVVLWNYPL